MEQKKKEKFHLDLSDMGIVIALFLLLALLIATNQTFRSLVIYRSILKTAAIYGVLGVGMSYAIIACDIDLSVGAQMALLSVIFTAIAETAGLSCSLATVAILLMGILLGTLNGLLIAKLHIPAFMATLGTQYAFRSLAQMVNSHPVITENEAFLAFSKAKFLEFPLTFWLMVIVVILGTLLLRRTRPGRFTLAIGNSKEAAKVSGINVSNTQLFVFIFIGLVTAIAALMGTARNASSNYGNFVSYEFTVITAVVLGGTSMAGGKGSIITTAVACVFISILLSAMPMYGINTYVQKIIQGGVMILAFSINTIRRAMNHISVRSRARKALRQRLSEEETVSV